MPEVEGASSNVVAPDLPERDRPALLNVPGAKPSRGTPQDKERAGYPASARKIRSVVFAIDGRSGPVLLADGVSVAGIPKSLYVGCADLRGNTPEGVPYPPSASSTITSGAAARMRSGSGSGWASNDQGQKAKAKLASARSHTVSVGRTSRTARRST